MSAVTEIAPAPTPAISRLPQEFLERMSEALGARFSISSGVRDHHGVDESVFGKVLPDGVAFPETNEEVAWIMQRCSEFRVPLIPYGAGTSIEGHILPVRGGITLNLSRMNTIQALNPEDLTVTVQAGITRLQLNEAIKHSGLFFPIDPGADATIGGMCATRASGTNAVRYQTMRENVLGMTVVTADGEVLNIGTRARKSSAGYDLSRIFIGSEGTLGIITEVTLRLYPLPEAVSAATCTFPDMRTAVRTVIETIQLGIPVARVEFVDALAIRAINLHDKLNLAERPTLFFEFHGTPASVEEQAETVQAIAASNNGEGFQWATRPEDRKKLWNARHNAYFAVLQLKPGCKAITTDVCVPISRLAECVVATEKDLAFSHLPAPIIGHVGDGNFHVIILVDPNNPAELAEAEAINERVVRRAIAMDGTCTGEHGIGLHKQEFLVEEQGAAAVAVMKKIKSALDPLGLLNPGKIFSGDRL